jgi:Uma2 family endonuclease
MATLVGDPQPAEIDALVERREALGLDRWDEVWDGVLHMNPPPSYKHERLVMHLGGLLGHYAELAGLELVGGVGIGVLNNNRVPDVVLQRPEDAREQWQETAGIAIEIVSPKDESWNKFEFYAAHEVDEVVIVDPEKRTVDWFGLGDGEYKAVEHSSLIDIGPSELITQIDWPKFPPQK